MKRVGVVGCGLMGAGIAEVCARSGADVVVKEIDKSATESGRKRILHSLDRASSRGKITRDESAEILGRIHFTTAFEDLSDREIVIEAVIENEVEKLTVFRSLDRVLNSSEAILASNTSSIPIMKLAMATDRPQNVIGMHFFNPVPVLPLVEVIRSLLSAEETAERAADFATTHLGKTVIHSGDRAGFIVNALLVPYLLSAVRMVESGFSTPEDIDTGMVEGCGHPMGPLALCDLIGIDTLMAVADSLYDEFKESLFAPPPMLSRMLEAGLHGRKSGRGFFDYADAIGAG